MTVQFYQVKGTPTPLRYADGSTIRVGDRFTYNLSNAKPEYRNPRYEVVFNPERARFWIERVGGGLDGGNRDFRLCCNPGCKTEIERYRGIGRTFVGRLLLWAVTR